MAAFQLEAETNMLFFSLQQAGMLRSGETALFYAADHMEGEPRSPGTWLCALLAFMRIFSSLSALLV